MNGKNNKPDKFEKIAIIISIVTILIVIFAMIFLMGIEGKKIGEMIATIIGMLIMAIIYGLRRVRRAKRNIEIFNNAFLQYEGTNRNYKDILDLLDEVKKHNDSIILSSFYMVQIKLIGIKTRSEVKQECTYSVNFNYARNTYISEIDIREE